MHKLRESKYKVYDDAGHIITAVIHHDVASKDLISSLISLSPRNGNKEFLFHRSKQFDIIAIAELMKEAAELGK